jgi:hypothetical protein
MERVLATIGLDNDFGEMSDLLRKLDQSELFERAFEYVKSKKNVKTVNLALLLDSFLGETKNSDDKLALGWTCLAMLRDRKENLLKKMSEEEFKKLSQSIIEKMC